MDEPRDGLDVDELTSGLGELVLGDEELDGGVLAGVDEVDVGLPYNSFTVSGGEGDFLESPKTGRGLFTGLGEPNVGGMFQDLITDYSWLNSLYLNFGQQYQKIALKTIIGR
jgi:hypothetical protein